MVQYFTTACKSRNFKPEKRAYQMYMAKLLILPILLCYTQSCHSQKDKITQTKDITICSELVGV